MPRTDMAVDTPTRAARPADPSASPAGRPPLLRRLASGRRRKFPWLLAPASVLIVAFLLSPLALIIIQAAQTGWSQLWPMLDRPFVGTLLWNTVRLAIVGTAACAGIGPP